MRVLYKHEEHKMAADKSHETGLDVRAEHFSATAESPEMLNDAIHHPREWFSWHLFYNSKSLIT